MATLSTFSADMAVHAPTAARPFLDRMYYEAAREFFRRTTAWREAVSFDDATTTYYWAPACYGITTGLAQVADYIYVKLNPADDPLIPLEANRFQEVHPNHEMLDATDTTSVPTHFYRAPYDSVGGVVDAIGLAPSFGYDVDNSGYSLHGVAALMPARGTTWAAVYLPDGEMREYHDAILDGALGRLLRVPDQRWTDLTLAQYYLGSFEQKLDEAKTRAVSGRLKGRVHKVKYRGP